MPQSDAVSKALSSAKAELGRAGSFPSMTGKAMMTGGAAAPKPVSAPAKKVPTLGDELAAKSTNVKQYTDSLPKMHEGGRVLSDGGYDLKAGEHVLTESQAQMARKHALMSIGMKRLSTPAKPGAAGELDTKKKPSQPMKVNPKKGVRK